MNKSTKYILYLLGGLVSLAAIVAVFIFLKIIPNPFFMMPPLQDTKWIKTQYHDLAYANTSAAQKLDLYVPNEGKGPYPVIVAIHGGAFLFGDKGDGQQNGPIAGVKRGYAMAAVNYRLAGEAAFPAGVQDVKAAIRFLKANAARFNIDPNRVVAWGDSAGGYMAVMAGVTGTQASEFDDAQLGNIDQTSTVQAVVDWFGPIDFAQMDAQLTASGKGEANHSAADSPESKFLASTVKSAPPELLRKANPLSYLSGNLPAFIIQHGDADGTVPTQQSIVLAEKLKPVLSAQKLQLNILPGARHGDPQFESEQNLNTVFSFLDQVLYLK